MINTINAIKMINTITNPAGASGAEGLQDRHFVNKKLGTGSERQTWK
jgi:hypothetical protein